MHVTWFISTSDKCVYSAAYLHTFHRHNSAARDGNNALPHETPRERFQQQEDKERAQSQ